MQNGFIFIDMLRRYSQSIVTYHACSFPCYWYLKLLCTLVSWWNCTGTSLFAESLCVSFTYPLCFLCVLFLFWHAIQEMLFCTCISAVAVSQTFLVFHTLVVWGVPVRCFVGCSSVETCLVFFLMIELKLTPIERDYRGDRVHFHHMVSGGQVLSCWPNFSTESCKNVENKTVIIPSTQVLFCPSYAVLFESSPCVQHTGRGWGVMLHLFG